ncbi:polyketide synthase dehydratase domain-containing protein [Streptomyces sp. L7]
MPGVLADAVLTVWPRRVPRGSRTVRGLRPGGSGRAGVRSGVPGGYTAVWRRDEELFAEVGPLPVADARRHVLHPALLDAALHPGLLAEPAHPGPARRLPFAWRGGLTVHATGATALRVRMTRPGRTRSPSISRPHRRARGPPGVDDDRRHRRSVPPGRGAVPAAVDERARCR